MQSVIPSLTLTPELVQTMQPHPTQNMILTTNKKTKKYVQSPPNKQQQHQQQQQLQSQQSQPQPTLQFQINKSYNVVSILKTTTSSSSNSSHQQQHLPAHQQQQQQQLHHHQQHQQQQQHNFANVLNRAQPQTTTILCTSSGNVVELNHAAAPISGAAAIYNLNQRALQNNGSGNINNGSNNNNNNALDGKTRFVLASSSGDICTHNSSNSPHIISTHERSIAASANSSSAGHTVAANTNPAGIIATLAGATTATAYIHDKSALLGISVGSGCLDNRKYDFKSNNLMANNSNNYQAATQEYVQQSTGNNNNAGGNTPRSNPQTSGGLYRGGPPPPNATQRGGGPAARHVHHVPTMYQPAMHQNVVLPAYAQFTPRQPTFSTPQFQYAHGPISTYYQYQYLTAIQQQPPPPPQAHQRSGVGIGVNTGVGGVPVGSTLPVQAGPNGPLAGPGATGQTQLSLPAGAVLTNAVQQSVGNPATVLGVGGGATNAGQVGVPSSLVGVMPPNVPTTTPAQQTNRRRHQHRLKIIDPHTNKNILDEYDKQNNSNSESSDYQEHVAPIAASAIVPPEFSQQEATGVPMAPNVVMLNNDTRSNMQFNIDVNEIPTQRDNSLVVGQTPIVSAMSDAPSVEILSTPQKPRSKKIIPILAPEGDEIVPTLNLNLYPEENSKAQTPANQHSNTLDKFQQQTNNIIAANQTEPQQQQAQQNQQGPTAEPDIITTGVVASVESTAIAITTEKEDPSGGVGVGSGVVVDSSIGVLNNEEITNITEDITVVVEAAAAAIATATASTATVSSMPDVLDDLSTATPNAMMEDTVTVEVTKLPAPVVGSSIELPAMESVPTAATVAADIINVNVTNDETKTCQLNLNSNNNNNNNNGEKPTSGTTNAAACDETDRVVSQTQEDSITQTADDADSAGNRKQAIDALMDAPVLPVSIDTTPHTNQAATTTAEAATTTTTTTAAPVVLQSLISYNEGQWSPHNPTGKKQYDREQLLLLREAKASRIQPDVNNAAILPQTNLLPSFMRTGGNSQHKRVQSMIYALGSNRGGDNLAIGSGAGNNINKQASMSGVQGRNSMKGGMIHVNLSLGQDVKLNETENAWRPSMLSRSDADIDPDIKNQLEKDELVRRVRGILNKLTPEKFNTLVEEIIKLKIDTPDKMDEVIVLVFEKAIDEPNFSVSYARLCHRLIMEVKARDERMESGTKSNLAHFRNALLDKTEREFTQNVSQSTAKEKKLQPIVDKIKKCTDPNEKAELEAFLEEEERKIRRRSGGTVRFIGELFKISMLTGKIIYSCIDTLLNPQSEDMLECLCKLLTTVGEKFELTAVNAKESGRCYSLEKSISKMQAIALKSDKDGARVSSRVRFMLQDVIDLRKNKWQTSRNEAPKTMGQIEKEAKNEQLSAQYMNYSGSVSSSGANGQSGNGIGSKRDIERGSNRYGGDGRAGSYGGSHSQRGGGNDTGSLRRQQQNSVGGNNNHPNGNNNNNNNDDNTWHVQTSKGSRSQAVDTNKLEGLLNQNMDTKKMGGLSQFQWTNNVSRQSATPTTTPSNSFAALSSILDKNSGSGERVGDRDRSGSRNKGSYNKSSMERDHRYNDRVMHTRAGSSSTAQGSRENSSSRGGSGQQVRSMMNSNATSSMQKSASHSKYTQQMPPTARMSNKSSMPAPGGGLYRNDQQQSNNTQQQALHSAKIAPPAVFEFSSESDLKLIKSVISEIIEMAAASKRVTPAAVSCIKRIPETQRCGFLYYILTDYLHLAEVGKFYRRYLAITTVNLIQQNHLSVDHFKLAYKEFAVCANDLIFDIPDLWLYIFQYTGPLIVKNILTVADLWHNSMKDKCETDDMGKKFLKAYLTYCTREVGPCFTRSMWKKFDLKWTDFMLETEVNDFIESNKLEHVENETKAPIIEVRETQDKHIKNVIEHIDHLLKEGANADSIIDYCNGNIVDIDKNFIRSLTNALSNFAILYKDVSYKLKTEVFQKVCIPVLHRYVDSQEERELECLYAMQSLVHSLEHPRGLLSDFFGELYDGDVIPQDAFIKWRDSKDQSAGKGVAVKGLNPFFTLVLSAETSDENN